MTFVLRHAWSLCPGDTMRDGRTVTATRLEPPLEPETEHRIWIEFTDGTGHSIPVHERVEATEPKQVARGPHLLADLDEWHSDMEVRDDTV